MNFTLDGGEYGDSAMGMDLGMMGARADTGRIRAVVKKDVKPHTLLYYLFFFLPSHYWDRYSDDMSCCRMYAWHDVT